MVNKALSYPSAYEMALLPGLQIRVCVYIPNLNRHVYERESEKRNLKAFKQLLHKMHLKTLKDIEF